MKCPGQDTRYWGDDAAFEVPCPKCGHSVEIFKDESSAKCTGCEHRFRNPKVDLKCAEWCAYAKECLGFAVSTVKSANLGEGALASRLIQVVKEEFAEDQPRITQALIAFQHAKELASSEGGDPRVVMAAVLLLDIGRRNSDEEKSAAGIEGGVHADLARPKRILNEIGVKGPTARQICRTIEACRQGADLDTIESRVVSDSYALTDLSSRRTDAKVADIDEFVDNRLTTDAAARRAQNLFRN
jgi:hypothetical protein